MAANLSQWTKLGLRLLSACPFLIPYLHSYLPLHCPCKGEQWIELLVIPSKSRQHNGILVWNSRELTMNNYAVSYKAIRYNVFVGSLDTIHDLSPFSTFLMPSNLCSQILCTSHSNHHTSSPHTTDITITNKKSRP